MPLLFSYGTLQRADVQRSTFGRTPSGTPDDLTGVEVTSATVDGDRYANVSFTGRADHRAHGVALEITHAELAAADEFERRASYVRVPAILVSGRHAWVYAHVAADAARDGVTFARTALDDAVGRALVGALNQELSDAYPEPGANHFSLAAPQVSDGRGAFLVIWCGSVPIGCGALRKLDDETAELKRMFVVPGLRGRGVGRRLVAALEAEARSMHVRRVVLETGTRQHAALVLYRAMDYRDIPLFGEYLLSPVTSVCLGKLLD